MTVSINNEEIERLLDEIVEMTGESRREALHKALEERRQRLALPADERAPEGRLFAFLRDEMWPQIPAELLGTPLSKQEQEDILGYGEWGV
jgi:antitoxin VapB